MKKILILFLFVYGIVEARVQRLSNIPPVKFEYIDVEPGICDRACLQELVDSGLDLSFLARYNAEFGDEKLSNLYARLGGSGSGVLLIPKVIAEGGIKEKIAVLIPENVIGGYSHVVSDAIFAYVTSQNINAEVKFYLTGGEQTNVLSNALKQIKNDEISLVIAPLTAEGAKYIAQNSDLDTLFFVPTLNYDMVGLNRGNIFFGGIDYKDQIRKLLEISSSKIVLYSDRSGLGNMLDGYVQSLDDDIFAKHSITNAQTTILGMIDSSYNNSSIFLNLPLNRTAMVATEIGLNKVEPVAILTTQINYAPKLLSSIKFSDRRNLYVANSIGDIPEEILSMSDVLGVDMEYNWVAYSSVVGLDYLYSTFLNPAHQRVFKESVMGSSIVYNTKIYKTEPYKFIKTQSK